MLKQFDHVCLILLGKISITASSLLGVIGLLKMLSCSRFNVSGICLENDPVLLDFPFPGVQVIKVYSYNSF